MKGSNLFKIINCGSKIQKNQQQPFTFVPSYAQPNIFIIYESVYRAFKKHLVHGGGIVY